MQPLPLLTHTCAAFSSVPPTALQFIVFSSPILHFTEVATIPNLLHSTENTCVAAPLGPLYCFWFTWVLGAWGSWTFDLKCDLASFVQSPVPPADQHWPPFLCCSQPPQDAMSAVWVPISYSNRRIPCLCALRMESAHLDVLRGTCFCWTTSFLFLGRGGKVWVWVKVECLSHSMLYE